MALIEKTIFGYVCERCGGIRQAASAFDADKPEGYFLKIERVTAAHNHSRSSELFLCDKDCLMEYIQFGISSSTVPWTPIGETSRLDVEL